MIEEKDKLTGEIKQLNAKNKQLSDELENKSSEYEGLRDSHKETEKSFDKEKEILNARIIELESELQSKNDILLQMETEINTLNDKIKAFEDKVVKKKAPKKIISEEKTEVITASACPNCGSPVYEEYDISNDTRKLVRTYCPNKYCGWIMLELPKTDIIPKTEEPEVPKKEIRMFKVKKDGLEEVESIASNHVGIIADPVHNIIWIWKGKNSSKSEYAAATQQAMEVKNKKTNLRRASIRRVEEGNEPKKFPNIPKPA